MVGYIQETGEYITQELSEDNQTFINEYTAGQEIDKMRKRLLADNLNDAIKNYKFYNGSGFKFTAPKHDFKESTGFAFTKIGNWRNCSEII